MTLHFLGPSLPFISGSRNDINENSIAFTLRYRSFCMLFTGDAGAAAEERFLAEGADLRCEVLKVGHHGSAYGSTPQFIAAVHPRLCDHLRRPPQSLRPSRAVNDRNAATRSAQTIYRTDENGAVTIITDGYGEALTSML